MSSPRIPDQQALAEVEAFTYLIKNERIIMTRKSIHLSKESGRINMTAKTAMVLPSPRSHPAARKEKTRIIVAPPIKGATSVTLLHVLPHLSIRRKRLTLTAQPTPQEKAQEIGT